MATKRSGGTTRGAGLVASIRAEMAELGVEPTSTEEEQLRIAESLADRLEDLERIIRRDGLQVENSKGELKTNPACVESRATALALTRALGGIYIGDSVTGPRPNAT